MGVLKIKEKLHRPIIGTTRKHLNELPFFFPIIS